MTAKIRKLTRQFSPTHQTKYKNLLVSGCSFVWNNSEQHLCTWPYYLRDLAKFDEVYDCSQSGAGTNHIFNSVINEIETNDNITPESTLIVVMWSKLTRTDVIATNDITRPWHSMSNYNFNDKFATLSLFRYSNDKNKLDLVNNLCKQYHRVVDSDAQMYESLLKIISLNSYLKEKKYEFIFLTDFDIHSEVAELQTVLKDTALNTISDVIDLNSYAINTNQQIPNDGHPTPDAHLTWAKKYLLPYLTTLELTTDLNPI